MTTPTLYELLPAHIRARDQASNAPLESLLGIVESQVECLDDDLARMYDNWFIETCDDWVVPYIADLLGWEAAISSGSVAAGSPGLVRALVPRREVANAIAHRRRKGTRRVLEELARDLAGWPAYAVEFFRRVAVTSHLDHLHPGRPAVVDLRRRGLAVPAGEVFDPMTRIVDVRRISNTDSRGLYNVPDVGLFICRLRRYPVTETPAYCREDIGLHCFTFSVLGNDAPLFRAPLATTVPHLTTRADLPLPIGRAELDPVGADLYGTGGSLALSVTDWPARGTSGVVPAASIIVADLSDWTYHVPKNKVALDPVLGRIQFAATQPPKNGVTVSYGYGFAAELGGGEYPRLPPPLPAPARRVAALPDGAAAPGAGQYASIAAAVLDWRQARDAADGPKAPPHLIVELPTSGVYAGRLDALVKAGESLAIIAAPETRPVLWLADDHAGAPDAISIQGARGSRVLFEGLLVAGRGLDLSAIAPEVAPAGAVVAPDPGNDLCRVLLRHCTFVPGWGLQHDCEPRRPSEPSLVLDGTSTCVLIERCILGAIRVIAPEPATAPARLVLRDSIVDATSDTRSAIAAPADLVGFVSLDIARSTVVGVVAAHEMVLAENSIFTGTVTIARRQVGCVRYSHVPAGSRTPRQYQCQPATAVVAARSAAGSPTDPKVLGRLDADTRLRVAPRFVARRYGRPDYLRLSRCTPAELATGSEVHSEMGVYHELYEPQRLALLTARLNDFIPASCDAAVLPVT
jgi:hypothetical protein